MSTPKWRLEALADLGRQRFAGRRDQAQRHLLRAPAGSGARACRRSRSARRRTRSGAAADAAEPALGRWRPASAARPSGSSSRPRSSGRSARCPGRRRRTAWRRRSRHPSRAGPAPAAVELGGPVGVGVRVHRALGAAGGPGRVEPEAGRRPGRCRRPSGHRRVRPKASSSTSAGCSGATGRDTMTFCTSWSDLTSAAVSVGSSAPDTSTACARLCSSM